jgi:hypothetical protein
MRVEGEEESIHRIQPFEGIDVENSSYSAYARDSLSWKF